MGSLHTLRDKAQLGLVGNESILQLSRETLASSGVVAAQLQARSVSPGTNLMGIRITLSSDDSPPCDIDTDVFCDGGGYNNYHVEVVDRMGADSFTPDSGVMISKTKDNSDEGPFQWMIDANPQNIELLDFYRPNGTASYITLGDYRQLLDALFHAGTRSGSEYEFVDEANRLHFYVVDVKRDGTGVLSYTVGVKSLDSTGGGQKYGVAVTQGNVVGHGKPTEKGVTCSFLVYNNGSAAADASPYLGSDVYRLNATVEGSGWKVELPNALVAAKFSSSVAVKVAVGADASADHKAKVILMATSESDPSVFASSFCNVEK
jgi:hypothetical protein